MVKSLLTSLVALLVVSGMAGVTASAAKEINMEEPLNALQTWSRQLVQEQVELQVQEQLQVRLDAGQPESSPEVPEHTRLRLEDQEMLQIQDRIQSQEQIQLQQEVGLQNGTGYQWGTVAPGNSYEPGSSPKPAHAPRTEDGLGYRNEESRKPHELNKQRAVLSTLFIFQSGFICVRFIPQNNTAPIRGNLNT